MRRNHPILRARAANKSDAIPQIVAYERNTCARVLVCFIGLITLLLMNFPAKARAGDRYGFRFFSGRNGHRVVEAYDIAETPDGSIWVATWGDGVHRIHKTDYKNYSASNGLPTNWYRGIEHIGDGTLWAHTRGLIPIVDGQVGKPIQRKPEAGLRSQ